LGIGSVGMARDCPSFLATHAWIKIRTSNFVRTFIGSLGTKAHEKFLGKVAVGVVRESRKFSWHPYIERKARSSLRKHRTFVLGLTKSLTKF